MDSDSPEVQESDVIQYGVNIDSNRPGFITESFDSKEINSKTDMNNDESSSFCDNSHLESLLKRVKDVSYEYQYLDHPADVILLGEGKNIKEALQSICVSLFNYMSDLSYVDATHYKEIAISGRGLLNLLYHLLDECLYLYSSEYFIAKHVLIEDDFILPPTHSVDEFNNNQFNIRAIAIGDYYDKLKHKCGTEIKAITMHYLNFQIWLCGQCYEYRNDMESQSQTEELLLALRKNNNNIIRCKVFSLVDI